MKNNFKHIDIDNDKVRDIVIAGYEVFTKNNFEKASTNKVVDMAGISRGLLYHYFRNKQELFDFLVYFSIKVIVVDLDKRINWEGTDFLDRIRESIILKFEVMRRYPYMYDFFNKYSQEIKKLNMSDETEEMSPGMRKKFYKYNIDFTLIKDGIDIEKTLVVIEYTFKGIANKYMDRIRANKEIIKVDDLLMECDEYIEFFKIQFYKD